MTVRTDIEIDASSGFIAGQFSVTGGLGYTQVTIHGLARPYGWRLEKAVSGGLARISQEIEGNDYWQAHDDPSSESFDLIFNVHNRDTQEYRLVR